jgi:hypothetical protein
MFGLLSTMVLLPTVANKNNARANEHRYVHTTDSVKGP